MSSFTSFLNEVGQKVVPLDNHDEPPIGVNSYRAELSRNGAVLPFNELSPNDRQFIEDIRGLDIYGRLHLVNGYINSRLSFKEQDYGTPDDTRNFSEIMASGSADCDDYAYVKAVMLHHAGVGDVSIVGAKVQYHFDEGSSGISSHALTVVELPEGGFYVMDNLVSEPYQLDSDLCSSKGDLVLPDNKQDGQASMEIHKILGISTLSANGQERYYAPAPETMNPGTSNPDFNKNNLPQVIDDRERYYALVPEPMNL